MWPSKIETHLTTSLFILLFAINLQAQEQSDKSHTISFSPQYYQFKDAFNYGLSTNGLNLPVEYEYKNHTSRTLFTYNASFSFGANYANGLGLSWQFKPIDLTYTFKLNDDDRFSVLLGGYGSANYWWQLYPELQSGQMFWFSSFEIGPKVILELAKPKRHYSFQFSSSIAGFSSRPIPSTETYYYSLKISDFIENPHRNLKFGSLDLFSHIQLKIMTKAKSAKQFSIGYGLEYFEYNQSPELQYISHAVILNWKLGKE